MFPDRYFPARAFAGRYWAKVGATLATGLTRVRASAKATQASAVSFAIAVATPPALGNGLIVPVLVFRGASAISAGTQLGTCTDTRGNTYVLAKQHLQGASVAGVFYCAAVTTTGGPFTITVSASTANAIYWVGQAVEFSGVGTGLVVDQTVGVGGTSATPATGATAVLTGSEVVQVGAHAISAAQASITVGVATPVWTQEFEELPFTFIAGEADTRVVSAATGTTPSVSWTDASSGVWAAVLAVFNTGAASAVASAQTYVWGPL